MATTKTEGFSIPGSNHHPARPSIAAIHRPFSDGSMTVDTDLLTSLMSSPHTANPESRGHYNMASPFNFSQSLPIRQHSFDYSMPSPLSTSINVAEHLRNSSLYGAPVKFGNEHPEPPINLNSSSNDVPDGQRSRSQSTSNVGKAPSSRSRQSRKSMTDVRPPRGSIQRGRSQGPGTGKPMGLGVDLDTHVEGELTDSISPPDFGANATFGLAIPRHDSINTDAGSWSGSVPSMVPGSLGSYDNDDVIVESPLTPVKSLPNLPPVDDSYKKQRRRECHNLVEKRRREHINAKIEELNTLLPEKYNQAVDQPDEEEEEEKAAKKKKKRGANTVSKAQKDAAHCKGRILTQSVNYIRELRETADTQAGRIAHLEAVIAGLGISGETIHDAPAQNFAQNQDPLFWLNGQHNGGTFENSGHQLQAMRPSPEPADRPFSFDIPAEKPWSAHQEYMPFHPSPSSTDQSSATSAHPAYPFSSLRRMSHSTSSDMSSPLDEGDRGRPKGRGVRQDSQAELQMGMSGLFSGHGQARDASTGSIW